MTSEVLTVVCTTQKKKSDFYQSISNIFLVVLYLSDSGNFVCEVSP